MSAETVVWEKSVSGFSIGSAVVQLLKAGSMHPANYLSYAIDVSTAIKHKNCPSPTNNPAKWPACLQISSKRKKERELGVNAFVWVF